MWFLNFEIAISAMTGERKSKGGEGLMKPEPTFEEKKKVLIGKISQVQ